METIKSEGEKNLSSLKTELSQEWNKRKAQNIKEDKGEARSYKKIKEIQKQIYKLKNPLNIDKEKNNKRYKLPVKNTKNG